MFQDNFVSVKPGQLTNYPIKVEGVVVEESHIFLPHRGIEYEIRTMSTGEMFYRCNYAHVSPYGWSKV